MNTHADKTSENKSKANANSLSKLQANRESSVQFIDNRPKAITQGEIHEMANNSPQVSQLRSFQEMANNSPQAKQTAQLRTKENNQSAQQQLPIQMFKSHPKSKKAPEISLDTEETEGGHTIERHVITKDQAMRRVVNEGQIPSSIWPSKSKANEATNSIISKNWYSIKEWANTQGVGQYSHDLIEDNTQGKVFWEDLKERDSERARLYLYRSKAVPGDAEVEVRVVTSYPEHAAKPADVGAAKGGNIKKTDKW